MLTVWKELQCLQQMALCQHRMVLKLNWGWFLNLKISNCWKQINEYYKYSSIINVYTYLLYQYILHSNRIRLHRWKYGYTSTSALASVFNNDWMIADESCLNIFHYIIYKLIFSFSLIIVYFKISLLYVDHYLLVFIYY